MNDLHVSLVEPKAVDEVAKLFDEYRQFYGQPSNLIAAQKFLRERVATEDSKIFVATLDNIAVGFAQLYPSFSSVAMRRIWILNDLFVSAKHRKKGVAMLSRKPHRFGAEPIVRTSWNTEKHAILKALFHDASQNLGVFY